MKIQKNCSKAEEPVPVNVSLSDIPTGTIFRYGNHECGPYLRTTDGVVDLKANTIYKYSYSCSFYDYKALPNAVLVTGEE